MILGGNPCPVIIICGLKVQMIVLQLKQLKRRIHLAKNDLQSIHKKLVCYTRKLRIYGRSTVGQVKDSLSKIIPVAPKAKTKPKASIATKAGKLDIQ